MKFVTRMEQIVNVYQSYIHEIEVLCTDEEEMDIGKLFEIEHLLLHEIII